MKRVAVGALLVSLLIGSVAMADQNSRGPRGADRGNYHSDNRGGHDNRRDHGDRRHNGDRGNDGRRNWNGGRNDRGHNDGNRNRDRHDWNRDHHRNDGHRNDGRRNDWDRNRHDWNRDRHDNRGNWRGYNPPRHYNAPRHYSQPRYYAPPRYGRYHYGVYNRPVGYYQHRWAYGERLPRAYYSRPYVVYDYDDCGLRSPPVGYHWVRVNTDVVLAAITTGIILDVAYNHFY